ncbi:Hypothetical_protein [Hexamita inflata]|uniref:Hypothetical_protein n=1 Tax=Hexamita inflata TaxID=28002 RepID=A0ABP1GDQ2_9EUKA
MRLGQIGCGRQNPPIQSAELTSSRISMAKGMPSTSLQDWKAATAPLLPQKRRWYDAGGFPYRSARTKQPRYAPGCLYPSRWLPWLRRCAQRTQVCLKLMIIRVNLQFLYRRPNQYKRKLSEWDIYLPANEYKLQHILLKQSNFNVIFQVLYYNDKKIVKIRCNLAYGSTLIEQKIAMLFINITINSQIYNTSSQLVMQIIAVINKVRSSNMTPGVKLVCEQFSLFSQILLVGVFIIQNSLIIHILFLLRKLTQRRELNDCLAFTKIQPKIQCASTKVTSRLGLLDNKSRSFQLCTVHQFYEVSKVLEQYGNS